MGTLEEALKTGEGIERPFQCEVHDDTNASASVNVLKNVWYCFACGASGMVGTKVAPSAELLNTMIQPEKAARTYPESFLELYARPEHWATRFPEWLCYALGLGSDPFTGDATFPVHLGDGMLAGVGRRREVTKDEAKETGHTRFRYPHRWSATHALFGTGHRYQQVDVVVAVEGASDSAAVQETGALGLATYGAGFHLPQRELLLRYAPKLVLLGFDMDDAGEKAVTRAFPLLKGAAEIKRVYWKGGDPAATPLEQRLEDLLSAVRRSAYSGDVMPRWSARVADMQHRYQLYVEESHG